MNVKEVLKELQYYDINEYDLRDLFVKAIRQDIEKTYKLYVEEREIVQADTIEDSVIATIDAIKQKFDSIDNAKLHHEWGSIYNSLRLQEHNEKETKFYCWEHRVSYLVYMLRYAVNGYLDSDYSETNKYMEEQGIKYDTNQGVYTLGNITFRLYKNHNVIVKGLETEQYLRIKKAYDNYKKYSYA